MLIPNRDKEREYIDKKARREEKTYTKECPNCGKKYTTKRNSQIYCNQKCYAKSSKLKSDAKNSRLIKDNSVMKWREGTKSKPFKTSTQFKKGDKRLMGEKNVRYNKNKEFKKLCLKIRNSTKYANWKRQILKRDKETGKSLHVHHIKPFNQVLKENNITSLEEAITCKELWKLENGLTIHKGEHHIISLLERTKNHTRGFLKIMAHEIKERQKRKDEEFKK